MALCSNENGQISMIWKYTFKTNVMYVMFIKSFLSFLQKAYCSFKYKN